MTAGPPEGFDNRAAVAWLASAPDHTVLFTDFDGTLSRIVARPELARPLPGSAEVLSRLARHLCAVGVVSGRPVAWLADQLGISPATTGTDRPAPRGGVIEIYGQHGVEHLTSDGVVAAEGALSWSTAFARVRASALAAGIPGLEVEDKSYGVTLHWRAATDQVATAGRAELLARQQAAVTGLVARPGKASIELVAPIGVDKGTVIKKWGASGGVERIAFFGDDESDIAAFAAIDEITAGAAAETGITAGAGAITRAKIAGLKIAVGGREAPAELLRRADLVLATPEEAVLLMRELAEQLDSSGSRD
ncbi:MAG: trehalose-phosphatase [Acidimicrobiales bacterium]